jgi:hypothetical protein
MRRLTIVFATLLLALMLYVVNMGIWVNRNIIDTETFVETTVSSLRTESSRIAVAEIIVDELAIDRPVVLLLEEPLIELFAAILETPEFEVVLTNVGVLLHATIIDGDDGAIESDLTSIEDLVRAPLRLIASELDALIPTDFFDSVAIIDADELPDASPYVAVARFTTIAAVIVALALAFLIASLSRPRRFSLVMIGSAVSLAALSTSWLAPGGRNLSIGIADDPQVEILIGNLYDALAVSLRSQSRLVAAAGIAVIMVGIVVSEWRRRPDSEESRLFGSERGRLDGGNR